MFNAYLPQLLINLEIEISLWSKKSYSQLPDLYEPVQAANVNTANNAKINFFIVSPFSCPPKRSAKEDVFLHMYIMKLFLPLCKFFILLIDKNFGELHHMALREVAKCKTKFPSCGGVKNGANSPLGGSTPEGREGG